MTRREARITIDDAGRDKGKTFVLTEMDSDTGERWALRLLFALMNAGVDVPENVMSAGMAGVAAMGIKALGKVPFEAAEPLLNEMMDYVQIAPDKRNPGVVRNLISDDIEEVMTRLKLRIAIFKLHVDFFTNADQLTPESTAATATGV